MHHVNTNSDGACKHKPQFFPFSPNDKSQLLNHSLGIARSVNSIYKNLRRHQPLFGRTLMSKWFVLFGRLEGVSFLVLLAIAMPLKYYLGLPIGVRVMGPVHGLLFLMYCAAAYFMASEEEWPLRKQLLAFVAAVIPFGTILFELRYLRSARNSS